MASCDYILVQASMLPELPHGVQRFIVNYFRLITVFGIEYYQATSSMDLGTEADISEEGVTRFKNGAKTDEFDIDKYSEGLDREKYPFGGASWIHKDGRTHPAFFFDFICLLDN